MGRTKAAVDVTANSVGAQAELPENPVISEPGDATDEFTVAPYEVPTWAEFRGYVMENGDKFVRATYPNPPVDLIETIWCGVPVEHHDKARVMTATREWLVY